MLRNRAHSAFFLAVALCLSVTAPGVAAGQTNVTLTVTVVDGDGDSVSGVDLSATWADGGGPVNETTRSNGQALVDVPEGANVTITVHDDDYVRNSPYEIDDAEGGDVEVEVAAAGSATIDVVDADGPVANATVRLFDDDERVVDGRTDGDGTLETRDIEQGDYEVRVSKQGYLRNATDLDVDGDVGHEVRIEQSSRLLEVTVRDDHFSPPQAVANANVTVSGVGTVATLSSGESTVRVPVNTDYDVSATKDGYETNETSVRVREEDESANLTIRRTDAISLEAGNQRVVVGESVRVTVTDEYGDPVSGADVAVDGDSAGQTDDQGETSVPIESAGTHNLTATSGDLEANATVEGVGEDGEPVATDTPTENETTDGETSDLAGPGFTAVAALVALLAVGLLARRD